jgi:hypothetical protein
MLAVATVFIGLWTHFIVSYTRDKITYMYVETWAESTGGLCEGGGQRNYGILRYMHDDQYSHQEIL